MVELSNQQQAARILTQTPIDIWATPHRSLNSSQGVIAETDLINETDADLLEGLKDEGVMAVRRITIRRESKEIPTKNIILTFDRSVLP